MAAAALLALASLGGVAALLGAPFWVGVVVGPVVVVVTVWVLMEALVRAGRRGQPDAAAATRDWLAGLTLADVRLHEAAAEAAFVDVRVTMPMYVAGPVFGAAGLWRGLARRMRRRRARRVGDLPDRVVRRAAQEADELGYPGVARAAGPDRAGPLRQVVADFESRHGAIGDDHLRRVDERWPPDR